MESENGKQELKTQIIRALKHPEAEEGLYFRNLFHLHEEDERQPVSGEEMEILEALRELIHEGRVRMEEGGEEVVFHLAI